MSFFSTSLLFSVQLILEKLNFLIQKCWINTLSIPLSILSSQYANEIFTKLMNHTFYLHNLPIIL